MSKTNRTQNTMDLISDNDQAERLGIDSSQLRAKEWKLENADALASYNEWVEKNGLPLSRYRQF